MASKNKQTSSQQSLFNWTPEQPKEEPPKEDKEEGTPSPQQPDKTSDEDVPFLPGTVFRLLGVSNGELIFWYDEVQR
jgi:hypothetical protein